ncbi:MAG: hypothetical protein O3C40_06540 [Planctomycetota bacterium]|nr:hypothetical protein [Planctomycetota bacterium]
MTTTAATLAQLQAAWQQPPAVPSAPAKPPRRGNTNYRLPIL